jgi:hypothetical protein
MSLSIGILSNTARLAVNRLNRFLGMRIQLLADSNEPFYSPLNDLNRRVEQL